MVGLMFWLVVVVAGLAGLIATDGGWDVVAVACSAGVFVALAALGLTNPRPNARPAPGTHLATSAETIRVVLGLHASILAVLVTSAVTMRTDRGPWALISLTATCCMLVEATSLWRVARAEREQPDLVLARAVWGRPERFGWLRVWGATAP
jgi:dipeptide/tripeptide permease